MTRSIRNMEIPATLVHTKAGRKYRVNGTLVAINESAGTCSMKFAGHPVQKGIPMSKVYINEGVLDDIKSFGKKVYEKIVSLVKTAAGFILPKYSNGDIDMSAMASTVNQVIVLSKLGADACLNVVLPKSTIEYYKKLGIELPQYGQGFLPSDSTQEEADDEVQACNDYWHKIMETYATNEDYKIDDAFRAVNESYGDNMKRFGFYDQRQALNEAITMSLRDYTGGYGDNVTKEELMNLINESLDSMFNSTVKMSDKPHAIMIWGAPGIGKTAIVKQVLKEYKRDMDYDLAYSYMTCSGFNSDNAFLPAIKRDDNGQMYNAGSKRFSKTKVFKNTISKMKDAGMTTDAEVERDLKQGKIIKDDELNSAMPYNEIDDMDFDEYINSEENQNLATQRGNVIQTAVKAQLPIYNVSKDDNVNIQRDAFINSGKFLNESNNKDGGLLFIDEFSRLPAISRNTMMAIVNEREDSDWRLGSRWAILGASNRFYDMGIGEKDNGLQNAQNIAGERQAAETQRWKNVHYVPSVKEWTDWARQKQVCYLPEIKNGGASFKKKFTRQNVDEFIIRFIESAPQPSAMLYKALITPPDIEKSTDTIQFAGMKHVGGYDDKEFVIKEMDEILKAAQMDDWWDTSTRTKMNKFLNQIQDANTYSPRTWVRDIWTPMYNAICTIFIGNDKNTDVKGQELFINSFDIYGNVDFGRLALNLQESLKTPMGKKRWSQFERYLSKQRIEESGNNPFDELITYFMWVVQSTMGSNSMVTRSFKNYSDYATSLTVDSYYNMWRYGTIVRPQNLGSDLAKADNIATVPQCFQNNKLVRWKSSPKMVREVAETAFSKFPNGGQFCMDALNVHVNSVVAGFNPEYANKNIKINPITTTLTPQIKQTISDNFGKITFNVVDYADDNCEKINHEKEIVINLFDYVDKQSLGENKQYANDVYLILAFSPIARQFFNFTKYWLKVSLETSSSEFLKGLAGELKMGISGKTNTLAQHEQSVSIPGFIGMDVNMYKAIMRGSTVFTASPAFKALKGAEQLKASNEIGAFITRFNPLIPAYLVASLYDYLLDAPICDGKTIQNYYSQTLSPSSDADMF